MAGGGWRGDARVREVARVRVARPFSDVSDSVQIKE
jgi:hypothetical protein